MGSLPSPDRDITAQVRAIVARIDASPTADLTPTEENLLFKYVAEIRSALRRRGQEGLETVGTLFVVFGRLFIAAKASDSNLSRLNRNRFEDFIREDERARKMFQMLRLRLRLGWTNPSAQSISRYMDWFIKLIRDGELENVKSILKRTFDGLDSFTFSLSRMKTNKTIASKPDHPLSSAEIAETSEQEKAKRKAKRGNRLGSGSSSTGQGSATASTSESVSAGPKSAQSGTGSKRPAQRIVSIEDADNAESPQQPEVKRSRRSAEGAEVPKDPEVLLKTLRPRIDNSLTRIERVRSRHADATTTSTILQRLYEAINEFSDGIADLEDTIVLGESESEPAEEVQQSDGPRKSD
jgi:hypothetical protein